ncbi:MAG: XRE family transcriptional regulator, partial [Nitrosopumilales archaeon CG_4_10_14_0_8_um_filter_34_8]
QIRVEKGLSQSDLARKIPDISQRYISEAERNLYVPAKDKLRRISDAL